MTPGSLAPSPLRSPFSLSLLDGVLLAVFIGALPPVLDYDLFFHLETGEWIARNGRVPRQDPFSVGAEGRPFTAHAWLPETLFHAIERSFGIQGVAVLKSLAVCGALYLVFLRLTRRGVHPFAAALILVPGILACRATWVPRPLFFSFPLFSGLLLLLESGTPALLWAGPLVVLAWANCHGSFILGIFLIAYYYAVESAGLLRGNADMRRLSVLGRALILSVAAACLNPYGPAHLAYPFQYLPGSAHYRYIQEWKPPDFRAEWGFEALIFLAILGFAASGRRPRLPEFFLFFLWLHQALGARRLESYFVLGALPLIGEHLAAAAGAAWAALPHGRASWLEGLERRRRFLFDFDAASGHRLSWIAVPALSILVLLPPARVWTPIGDPALREAYGRYPRGAADELARRAGEWKPEDPRRRCLVPYHFGGYFIRRLHDLRLKPFVDGRMDVFPPEVMEDYRLVQDPRDLSYQAILRKYNIGSVLWPAEAALSTLLDRDPEWERAFTGPGFAIFLRKEAAPAPPPPPR